MLTVEQLRRKLRGIDPKAIVVVRDHDNADDEINGIVKDVSFTNIEDTNREAGGWGLTGPAVVMLL